MQVITCGSCNRRRSMSSAAEGTDILKLALEFVKNSSGDVQAKLAELVEWWGLCESEKSVEEDGFKTEYGNFAEDYESAESVSYEEYYGEDAPEESAPVLEVTAPVEETAKETTRKTASEL
jgi:hypothetical protein